MGNIPWNPTLSPLAGYFKRIGMSEQLVANSSNDYFNIASRLAKDREYAYHIRVKLLEAVDGKAVADFHNSVARQVAVRRAAREAAAGDEDPDVDDEDEDDDDDVVPLGLSATDYSHHRNRAHVEETESKKISSGDLNTFLEKVGRSWSLSRIASE